MHWISVGFWGNVGSLYMDVSQEQLRVLGKLSEEGLEQAASILAGYSTKPTFFFLLFSTIILMFSFVSSSMKDSTWV